MSGSDWAATVCESVDMVMRVIRSLGTSSKVRGSWRTGAIVTSSLQVGWVSGMDEHLAGVLSIIRQDQGLSSGRQAAMGVD